MPSLRKNLVVGLSRLTGHALAQLSKSEIEGLARFVGARRHGAHAERVAYFAKCLQSEYFGITNRTAENGELWLMQATAPLAFRTVFDIGANVGNWTSRLLDAQSTATVHCFEIVPATFSILQANLRGRAARVVLNPFGLGEQDGELPIYMDPKDLTVSSAYDFGSGEGKVKVAGQIKRASDYCMQTGLSGIDFLKIDVEGSEAMVVRGFLDLLRQQKIRLLQFEYNRGSLESGFLLKDFYALLEPLGYRLGKLFPNGVRFHDYSWEYEDFTGPNYVACRTDDQELIKCIEL